jgi:hypothetical protein
MTSNCNHVGERKSRSVSRLAIPVTCYSEENSFILRLPILPPTQPFNSVSGEGYPLGPTKGQGFVEYGHSRLRNQLSTTQYSVAHHSEPARRKTSKEEKSKQVNLSKEAHLPGRVKIFQNRIESMVGFGPLF